MCFLITVKFPEECSVIDFYTHFRQNLCGLNFLQRLYEDPKRWTFQFQSYVQLTRLGLWMQIGKAPVTLVERSVHSNRFVYLEVAKRRRNISKEEYSILTQQ